MKKGKEWLKESIKNSELVSSAKLYDLIDQLDEPEQEIDAAHDLLAKITTLSQEDFDLYWNCINDGVAVSDLKQEKVVIPQFVADWIEAMKQQNFTLGEVAEHLYSGDIKWSLLREYERWARLNFTKFARAWIDGYEVEKPEQWVVEIGNGYFTGYDEMKVTYVLNDGPPAIDYACKYEDEEEAQIDADQIGGKVKKLSDIAVEE